MIAKNANVSTFYEEDYLSQSIEFYFIDLATINGYFTQYKTSNNSSNFWVLYRVLGTPV